MNERLNENTELSAIAAGVSERARGRGPAGVGEARGGRQQVRPPGHAPPHTTRTPPHAPHHSVPPLPNGWKRLVGRWEEVQASGRPACLFMDFLSSSLF